MPDSLPSSAPDGTAAAISELRERIDALDEQIARLLQERAEVSLHVGRTKNGGGSAPIFVPHREAEVLERVQTVPGPLPREAMENIYREILSASRVLQRPLRIAHLGPEGTFGHEAARLRFGSSVHLEPCLTNVEVFTVVEKGAADYGMVPFENSTEGPVNEVLDRLVDTPLQACDEVTVPVVQTLMSRAESTSAVERILSHPQASAQCRGWLSEHLPGLPVEAASSTARAAELASQDPRIAAIAPRLAAEVYGLNVLAESIQDLAGNATRFLVLARSPSERPTGRDRTGVVFSIRDRVGALRDLTDAFASQSVNLSSIQSRPSKRKAWDYLFFLELDGHLAEDRVQRALDLAKEHTVFLKVIGSWPNRGD